MHSKVGFKFPQQKLNILLSRNVC